MQPVVATQTYDVPPLGVQSTYPALRLLDVLHIENVLRLHLVAVGQLPLTGSTCGTPLDQPFGPAVRRVQDLAVTGELRVRRQERDQELAPGAARGDYEESTGLMAACRGRGQVGPSWAETGPSCHERGTA